MDQSGPEQNPPGPGQRYTIRAVEDVYDAFDEFEHRNALDPFTIEAASLDAALREGGRIARERNDDYRKKGGFWSSGTFSVSVAEVLDEAGNVLYKR